MAYFVNASTATLKRNWIRPLSEVSTEEDTANKTTWYKIPIKGLSDKSAEADREYGWIKKGENNQELNQYDLKKLDFTVIEETDDNTNGDAFVDANKVTVKGEEEINRFFWNIYNEIDRLGDKEREGHGDKKLSPDEIQEAYKDEELSDILQKIIGYHPTEWQDKKKDVIEVVAGRLTMAIDADKKKEEVEELDKIRGQHEEIVKKFCDEQTLHFLKQEQKRLEKLVFWDNVPEIKDTPKVWHFHPVAFVEQLNGSTLPEMDVCPIGPTYRSHFVLHSTGGVMSKSDIQAITTKGRAHQYIMKDGEVIVVWPFTQKDVWATKMEDPRRDTRYSPTIVWGSEIVDAAYKTLLGQMFHVELNYAEGGVPTEKQYQVMADLYIEAALTEGYWPRIVPHIEVDRGIKDGHRDPENFNYNHFYQILRGKGVPLDKIPHFDHDRYWVGQYSKIPWGTDITSWPPRMSGNPHATK